MIQFRIATKGDGSLGFQQLVTVDGETKVYELRPDDQVATMPLGLYDENMKLIEVAKANPYHDAKGKFTNSLRLYYKSTSDFVHGKSAGEVITTVVKHHKAKAAAKEVVSIAISSILTHASQQHGSFQDKHVEEFISHTVHNMSASLGVPKEKVKALLKDSVEALKSLRKKKGEEIDKAQDGVLEVLTQLGEALESSTGKLNGDQGSQS